ARARTPVGPCGRPRPACACDVKELARGAGGPDPYQLVLLHILTIDSVPRHASHGQHLMVHGTAADKRAGGISSDTALLHFATAEVLARGHLGVSRSDGSLSTRRRRPKQVGVQRIPRSDRLVSRRGDDRPSGT